MSKVLGTKRFPLDGDNEINWRRRATESLGQLLPSNLHPFSCWGNRWKEDHWGDLGVDGWKILGWISRRWDMGIWTGLG